ncbi:MAG: fibronectin type III domain-containing protein, partial [Clostridia bacterium]|nr:fibronectin type III domain-containing protein [Clostridia bacterium]
KWAKNEKATGYEIQYATNAGFTSAKTVTVSGASTLSKAIASLTKGSTYYVRVRAYKTVSSVKYYSAWSAAKSVKITK